MNDLPRITAWRWNGWDWTSDLPVVSPYHSVSMYFFSGVPVLECYRVDDTSPELCSSSSVGLPLHWMIAMLANCLSSSIPSARWYVSTLEDFSSDWSVHLHRFCLCHVPEEAESPDLNKRRNWRAAGSFCNSGISYIPGMWDPEDFTEWLCIKIIQSCSKSSWESKLQSHTASSAGGHRLCTTWPSCHCILTAYNGVVYRQCV